MASNRQSTAARDAQERLFKHKLFFGSSKTFEDSEVRAELGKHGTILEYSKHWDKTCGYITFVDPVMAQSLVSKQILLPGGAVIEIRAYTPSTEDKRESDANAIKALLSKHQRAVTAAAAKKGGPLNSSSISAVPKVPAWTTGALNIAPAPQASPSTLNANLFPALGNPPSLSASAPTKPKPQPIAAPSAPVIAVKARPKQSAPVAATVANPQVFAAASSSLVGGRKVDVQIKEQDVPLQAAVSTRFFITLLVANDTNTSKTLESVSVDGAQWKGVVSIETAISKVDKYGQQIPTTIGPQQGFPVQVQVNTPADECIIAVSFNFKLKERSLKHKLRIFVVDLPEEEAVPHLPNYRPDSFIRRIIPYPDAFVNIRPMEHVPKYPNPESMYQLTAELRERLEVAKYEPLPSPVWKNRSEYKARMHDLLWMEEMEEQRLLRQFDLPRTQMAKMTLPNILDPILSIEVPSLTEKRPTISVGDTLYAWVEGSKDVEYRGYICSVKHAMVVASFAPEFHERVWREDLYFTVRFSISRHPFLIEHVAVDAVNLDVVWPDPSLPAVPTERKAEISRDSLADPKISQNEMQMKAVSLGLNRKLDGKNIPLLMFGPFGTGKTRTLVELIYQIFQTRQHAHILVCALSNSAADILAERLVAIPAVRKNPHNLLRLYAHTRSAEQGDQTVAKFTWRDPVTGQYGVPPHLRSYRIVVATCNNTAVIDPGFKGHFSHVVIDEAAQVKEAVALIPLSLADRNTSVIMAGDPQQLHYKPQSKEPALAALSLSIMERLLVLQTQANNERPQSGAYIYLNENYRSHPKLMEFASKHFYNGELRSQLSADDFPPLAGWDLLGDNQFPMLYASIQGTEQSENDSPSYFNMREAKAVVLLIQSLLALRGNYIKPEEIGVISPFWKQTVQIRSMLKKLRLPSVTVASITGLQGREFKALFVSTVRTSKKHLESDVVQDIGFINNPNALNTVVTRAKALLVVVGDPYTIRLDPHWDAFVQDCYENRNILGDPLTPEQIEARAHDDEEYMAHGGNLVTEVGQSRIPYEDLVLRDAEPFGASSSAAPHPQNYLDHASHPAAPSFSQSGHPEAHLGHALASLGNPTLANGTTHESAPSGKSFQKNAPEYRPSPQAIAPPSAAAHSDTGDRTLLIMDNVPFLLRIPGCEPPHAIVGTAEGGNVEVHLSLLGYQPRVTKIGQNALTIELLKGDGPLWSNVPHQQALQIVIPNFAVHYNFFATPSTMKIVFYRSPNITPLVGSDDFAKLQLQ